MSHNYKVKIETQKSIRIVTVITTIHGRTTKDSSRAYTSAHNAAVAYTERRLYGLKNRPKTSPELEELKRRTYERVRPIFQKMLDK